MFLQGDLGFDDPFLHSLVSGLIASIPDEFSAEEFVTAVFDEFFMSGIARENVIRHMWVVSTITTSVYVEFMHPTYSFVSIITPSCSCEVSIPYILRVVNIITASVHVEFLLISAGSVSCSASTRNSLSRVCTH